MADAQIHDLIASLPEDVRPLLPAPTSPQGYDLARTWVDRAHGNSNGWAAKGSQAHAGDAGALAALAAVAPAGASAAGGGVGLA